MTFLFDANAVSDFVDQHPRLTGRTANMSAADRVVICPIVRGEIIYGVERLPIGRRRDELDRAVREVLRKLPCEHMDASVGDAFARTKRACELKGTPVAENDLWIAATAIALDATVVTRDSDLWRIPALRIEDWTK
jgi:tRNA(fMet)-specific endonuclease VapC